MVGGNFESTNRSFNSRSNCLIEGSFTVCAIVHLKIVLLDNLRLDILQTLVLKIRCHFFLQRSGSSSSLENSKSSQRSRTRGAKAKPESSVKTQVSETKKSTLANFLLDKSCLVLIQDLDWKT